MSSLAGVPGAARSIIHLGMDVHKDSITIAVVPAGAKAPTRLECATRGLVAIFTLKGMIGVAV